MNIIFFIADSVPYNNVDSMSFLNKCQSVFNNHWTNATWTIPSIASMFTGKVPTTENPVYSDQPHEIHQEIITNSELWNLINYKYYFLLATPWEIVRNLFCPVSSLIGSKLALCDFPHINDVDLLPKNSYYSRRFKRRNLIDFKSLPRPFFHIYHSQITHSEFRLPVDVFMSHVKKGPDCLKNDQKKQIQIIDDELNSIYNSAPDDTLIIFTSDHGEDFNVISKEYNCGHATCYTDNVLRVPLALCYKGNNFSLPNKKEINEASCHLDLYNQVCSWIEKKDKESLPFSKNGRDKIIFTQGSKIGESSIKKIDDIKVGIRDLKNDVLYTQSMVTDEEQTNKPISQKLKDEYRRLVLQNNIK